MRRLVPAVLAVAALALLAGPAVADTGDLIGGWGKPGEKKGKLGLIYGLARDANGHIWVADTSNNRVQRFSAGGIFQRKIDGNLSNPEGVAVGPDNKIYVTDSLHDKIKVFGPGGTMKRKWGDSGGADGEFDFPSSVAVAPNGDVYVADRDNDRVQKFESDGDHVLTCDGLNLDRPNGVAVDASDNNVYIADTEDDEVVKMDPTCNQLGQWTSTGRPSMLAAGNGFVYVTDGTADRVQKFETDGDFVDEWGESGSGPGDMNSPCGIALSPGGKVYVAEFLNSRVQKFEG
ncbi:MAG: hypothetical protein ACRDWD_17725 [Acidimicrobiia bacterium]